jgi:superfamily II DNA/RNA helicase
MKPGYCSCIIDCIFGRAAITFFALMIMAFSTMARASAPHAGRRLISQPRRLGSSVAWLHSQSSKRHPKLDTSGKRNTIRPIPYFITHCNPQHHHCALYSSSTSSSSQEERITSSGGIFADPDITFESMGIQSPVLLQRLKKLGLTRPTAVQAASFEALSSIPRTDLTIGAETGSGKTLAYLLPLLDDILQCKKEKRLDHVYARAMILVPNKELVQQIARMAMSLSGGRDSLVTGAGGFGVEPSSSAMPKAEDCKEEDMVRLAVMPGGLNEPTDFPIFRNALQGNGPPVDLLISTPAAVGPLGLSPKNINMFADIGTLVCDEADMLLDGGYIRPLEQVLLGFRRADKLDNMHEIPRTQHVFVAATLPDFGLRSVDAYLQRKFPRANHVALDGMHNARHYGLSQPTLWIEEESKKARLNQFIEMLGQDPSDGGLQGQKVMVFLNSVDDVEGVFAAFEQNEINALPYHAKMSLPERTKAIDRFRQYNQETPDKNSEDAVPVLVCTDLAARGVDIPGVHAIVQLQFAGNVVAHLHRMGRCGRAGHRTGRGIVFYNEKERELVQVVQGAEEQQEKMTLQGQEVMEFDDDGNPIKAGTVKKAFSRKRGFTKKRKKERRIPAEGGDDDYRK